MITSPSSIEQRNIVVGSTLTLHCSADGLPVPTISWIKGANSVLNVSGDARIRVNDISFEENFKMITNSTLVITNTLLADEGDYTCIATNVLNATNQTVARVFVQGKPRNFTAFYFFCVLLQCLPQ